MNSPLVRFRKAGSCVAGLLIGFSIVIAVFAVMEENSSDWLTILLFGALVFGAPIIFALGQTSVRLSAQPKTRIERGTRSARRASSHWRECKAYCEGEESSAIASRGTEVLGQTDDSRLPQRAGAPNGDGAQPQGIADGRTDGLASLRMCPTI